MLNMYSPVKSCCQQGQWLTNIFRVSVMQPAYRQILRGEKLRSLQNFHSDCTRLVRLKQRTSDTSSNVDESSSSSSDFSVKSSVLKASAKELLENAADFQDQLTRDKESQWATTPYPEGGVPRSQAAYSLRPRTNPRETSILLFPGEGSQFVGMGKDLMKFPSVRDIFECASEVVQFNLLKLCLQGPKSELDKPSQAQVATLVCSIAAVERLKEERPSCIANCIAAAGFGVGELSALLFADVMSFERAVRLAQVRGEAMQWASEQSSGGMMTVLYGPDSRLGKACFQAKESAAAKGIEKPECAVSYYLFPHCKVVSGHIECLKYIEENKKEFKLKSVRWLPVSAAYYSQLMRPAVEPFGKALSKAKLSDPLIAVHSNVDGKRYKNAHHIMKQLPKQLVKPIKWEQILHVLYERPEGEGFPQTFECGPGKSLSKILKMVNSKAWQSCENVQI